MRLAALLSVVLLLAAAGPAAADDGSVFRFHDDRIDESSALVDLGRWMVTANDSGDSARIFVLDSRTGETVGVTNYGGEAVDVEALAPAGPHAVWVGDIGDNFRRRSTVSAYRVPVAAGDHDVSAQSYRLTYPDGPHDAESLVAAPDGGLYVITKGFTGGTVYRTPAPLDPDRVNVMEKVAAVGLWATDAALLRDHRHVIVRGYSGAAVYTFPGFREVGSFRLPAQDQGEGISVGPGGRIRLSSEGTGEPVLQVALPDAISAELTGRAAPAASPAPTPTPTATASAAPEPTVDHGTEADEHAMLWLGLAVAAVVAAGAGIAARRRGR